MKKTILLSLVGLMSTVAFSQSNSNIGKMVKPVVPKVDVMETQSSNGSTIFEAAEPNVVANGDRSVTIMDIGSSSNVYSVMFQPRTYLFADNNVKSVVFTHRMLNEDGTFGNSRIAYDVSTEAGVAGSWTNNIHVYDPLGENPGSFPLSAGRYPQGGIINPQGNTDPANCTYTYFIPTLDNSNDSWGGYGFGVNQLTDETAANVTQHNVSSADDDRLRLIPRDFTITNDGVTWAIDEDYNAATDESSNKLIINKGVLNADGDIEYTESEWDFSNLLDGDDWVYDYKIAFAPDGQTGYLLFLSRTLTDPQPYTSFHPVLYETTDGGDTWSDTPIHCQLGGADGIDAVKEFAPDDVLEDFIGAGFNRDEIDYFMCYQLDMVVDMNGNPHITGYVSPLNSNDEYLIAGEGSATVHLWYDRSSEEWDGTKIYTNKTFQYEIESQVYARNRAQASRTMDGSFVFFSCIDTDIEEESANLNPDIYCIGYDVYHKEYSDPMDDIDMDRVTEFTEAMFGSYFAMMSPYVFSEVNETEGTITCTVPFAYAKMTAYTDMDADVQYKYIDGWEYTFDYVGVGNKKETIATVKQNYPNPVSSSTTVEVEVSESANLSIEVSNLVGQIVYSEDRGTVGQGTESFIIDAQNYKSGVYFYTVRTNNSSVTKKMIVE